MHHFPFWPNLFPILALITAIVVISANEVVEDGTTDEQDMAKALALSKTYYWRNMMMEWDCKNDRLKSPEQIGFKQSHEKLLEICEHWKMMALAANAYVKGWECEEKRAQRGGTSSASSAAENQHTEEDQCWHFSKHGPCKHPASENSVKFFFVKTRFIVDQGELQMSSAMEAIKAVYRDLFDWGKGNGLKNEIKIKNSNATPQLDVRLNEVAGLLEALNGLRNIKVDNYLIELEKVSGEYQKQWKRFENKNLNEKEQKEIVKRVGEENAKLWELMKEIGLDWSSMCEAGKEFFSQILKKSKSALNSFGELKNAINELYKKQKMNSLTDKFKPKQLVLEGFLGPLFFIYRNKLNGPLMASYAEKVKQKLVTDPCEEAKLKVKKKPGKLISSPK